jgi:hypothetical protein
MSLRFVLLTAALPVLMVWEGCGSPRQLTHAERLAPTRSELDARTGAVFARGVLYKPRPVPVETLSSKLAPLIIQEVGTNAGPAGQSFGIVREGRVDPTRPAVYSVEGEISIQGRSHLQVTYFWCYPPSTLAEGAASVQGLRITLNTAGAPVIWEPLTPRDAGRVFFVAESLEAGADAEFGPPLPGRRYSIEPGLEQGPLLSVARVIDDGPIPMGPVVYLEGRSGTISTVLCRCMPAQVAQVPETQLYDLLPLEDLADGSGPLARRIRDWLEHADPGRSPLANLRLPQQF